jgi:hypothetical protein
MGNIVLPDHDSFFSISVQIESDFFDLVVISDIFVRSKVPGDDDTGAIPKQKDP